MKMKTVLIIGSGIAGMTAAISCAEKGIHAILVSPFTSERSQSVMAAGGINAALDNPGEGDSVESHIEDTLKGGCSIAGEEAVSGLCRMAPDIIRWLESLGTVFTLNREGRIDQRAFGGQSYKRTCYAGSSTGKQIVSALVMECRRYEALGLIERRTWFDFHSALIREGRCYGALLYNEAFRSLEPVYADAVIMATGGQNALFGKTTGSTQCDGYAAGRLFMQGAELKNLEFIQYHPTTLETPQKRMLISEAARGEGGRLYYVENGERVYFMEDLYGPKGNLMPRDVVSREMYKTGRDIYLDVSFLGKDVIDRRLPEVRDLCMKYRGIDITKESIPVAPSVHFFMGGLAVDERHETNIKNLYAVGECASRYHGANRLGGNSLLAAIYGGKVAAAAVAEADGDTEAAVAEEDVHAAEAGSESKVRTAGAVAGAEARPAEVDFSEYIEVESRKLTEAMDSKSPFPVMYIRDMVAENMWKFLGIVREESVLDEGIEELNYYLSIAEKIHYDSSVLAYFNYSLVGILTLAKATLISAKERRESRGSHFRSDYPEENTAYGCASIIRYEDGAFEVRLDREGRYES